jgi:hypothetical protein
MALAIKIIFFYAYCKRFGVKVPFGERREFYFYLKLLNKIIGVILKVPNFHLKHSVILPARHSCQITILILNKLLGLNIKSDEFGGRTTYYPIRMNFLTNCN